MCSGLCEIKDTGDSALASSEAAGNIWALLYPRWAVQTNLGRKYPHRQRAWHGTAVALGPKRQEPTTRTAARHAENTSKNCLSLALFLFFVFSFKRNSRWFQTAGNDAFFFKSLQLSQWQESEPSVGSSRDTHTEWGKEKDLWLKCVCVVSYIID